MFFGVCLVMLMIGGSSLAIESQGSPLIINLPSGDTGKNLRVEDIDWPDCTEAIIDSVNAGYGELYVEITNDQTIWELVKWLKEQPKIGLIDSTDMNLTLDGALNVVRMQNIVRLMRARGLERLALRHIPSRDNTVTITIYYVPYRESKAAGSDTVYVVSDTSHHCSIDSLGDKSRWAIGFGGQVTPVTTGRRILMPTVSLTMERGNCRLGLTGGYWPGELDQKSFVGSFAYFPGGGHFGWRTEFIYASRTIETFGAYVQKGYGPLTGLEIRSHGVSLYLTGGFQYLDFQGQDPEVKASANLGLNIQAISF